MPTCFVIQPFDKGAFDKRYDDVLEPAIEGADLEAYRVDRDPGASIPIEDIEKGIRGSTVCLADITGDNPNVWFELGFAIASGVPEVLVAAASRQRFPFDVQHRKVITYETDSSSDFATLQENITQRLKAVVSKEAKIGRASRVASPVAPVEGLASHELVTLVTVAENLDGPSDRAAANVIRRDMDKAGFTRVAMTLGLTSLLEKGLLSVLSGHDEEGLSYTLYSVTETGFQWLQSNQDRLVLKFDAEGKDEDEVPF